MDVSSAKPSPCHSDVAPLCGNYMGTGQCPTFGPGRATSAVTLRAGRPQSAARAACRLPSHSWIGGGDVTDKLSQEGRAVGAVDAGTGDEHWTFGDWVDLLGGHFVAPGRAGIPVTLFVDDEILASLSGLPPGAAASSLVRAITERFGELTEDRAYHDVARATAAWERAGSEGYIRCLPLIALAVLAGTRMAGDGAIRKTNYYKRYRALIGMSGGGRPPGYDMMPELWSAYGRWLDETLDGALGVSTVAEHPTYRFIGPALSQALFRASDRHELTYFLDSLGAPVTNAISRERIVALPADLGRVARALQPRRPAPHQRPGLRRAARAPDQGRRPEVGRHRPR